MRWIKDFISLLKESFNEWKKDKASRLAAALSYYTIFSLAPLVIVMLTILGWVYRDGSASKLFLAQMTSLIGESGGEVFQTIVEAASQPAKSTFAAIIGIVTAIFGATGVFVQLKDALNVAWGITEERFKGLRGLVRIRAISLTAILVIGFLLLVSLFVSTALTALTSRLSSENVVLAVLIQIFNQALSIGLIMVLFAFMYKFLPDIKIAWKDVWVGALFTSILFNIGKYLIGLYLGNSNVGSSFGAAGSILVILLWVYYSAQLILFGAEFTEVYSARFGSRKATGTPKTVPGAAEVVLDEKGQPIIEVNPQAASEIEATKRQAAKGDRAASAVVLGLLALPFVVQFAQFFRKPRK